MFVYTKVESIINFYFIHIFFFPFTLKIFFIVLFLREKNMHEGKFLLVLFETKKKTKIYMSRLILCMDGTVYLIYEKKIFLLLWFFCFIRHIELPYINKRENITFLSVFL